MKMRSILTAAAIAAVLMPAAAFAEGEDYLSPYAQARIYSGYVSQSKEMSATAAAAGKTDTQLIMKNVDARLGVKGKKGDFEGVAEIGFGKDAGSASTDVKDSTGTKVGSFNLSNTLVTTRHIYGVWNFAPKMNLLLGQTEAPYAFYSSCATDGNNNKAFGATHQDRDVQIKLTAYGAYIDLLNPTTSPASGGSLPKSGTSVAAKNLTVLMPKTALGYDFKMKNDDMDILVGGGVAGQTLKISKKTSTTVTNGEYLLNGKSIISYLAYAHTKVKVGGFSILGNFGYGQNTSNMGLRYDSQGFTAAGSSLSSKLPSGYIASCATGDGKKLKNSTSMEGFIDAGYDFGVAEVRGGYGMVSVDSNVSGTKARTQSQYFGQVSVPVIAKKLWIKPEVAYRSYGKDSTGAVKQGTEWVAGLYAQANID